MSTPAGENNLPTDETMANVEYRMPEPMQLDTTQDLLPRWKKFKLQFQIFLTAAGFDRVSEVRKAAILLNSVGHDVQEMYFNILKTEETTKYEQIIKIFDDYFEPRQNELISTYNFFQRSQEDGESFDLFYTEIKKLVKNCNYKELEERMLRDRIVLGIKDQKLQRKLLERSDLTLQNAVDMCRATELSRNHSKKMHPQSNAVDVIQKQTSTHPQRSTGSTKAKYTLKTNRDSYDCKKCGTRHKPRNCPAYGKICTNCHKLNHFKIGCKFINEIRMYNNDTEEDGQNNIHDL